MVIQILSHPWELLLQINSSPNTAGIYVIPFTQKFAAKPGYETGDIDGPLTASKLQDGPLKRLQTTRYVQIAAWSNPFSPTHPPHLNMLAISHVAASNEKCSNDLNHFVNSCSFVVIIPFSYWFSFIRFRNIRHFPKYLALPSNTALICSVSLFI